ncbi:lipopolysaccharide assembly protein LapB [Thiocystis minor]|uniref:lipopolysaccharide assembly protein LapB n=1 Tax=Thiocystis minor TaxID=61597 RepID=UPI001914BEE7|nr:lipopolysaccharide assembly protein LapB [Thiocystis minor]MBK5964113.1 lipopolysaccharide assembly protein LapB [Thiocystis minor]
MIELLFLLLPIAAASGWWLSRRDLRAKCDGVGPANPDFLRGLNYLLEEQPDKAIDLFLKLAEVNGETVETHLALGSLFRRRGEVDRAIRIHQNLVERKNLSAERRGYALFELGQDYMCAGLLDRAEVLFQELVELDLHRKRALHALRDIYQRERDWVKCLEVAERLRPMTEQSMAVEIAHYHCELAEDARRKQDSETAQRQLMLAQEADPNGVRAAMLEGYAALDDGDPQRAVVLFLRVVDRGSAYVAEILPSLIDALRQAGRDDTPALLENLARRHPTAPLIVSLAAVLEQTRGAEAALDLLTEYLSRYADLSGLERQLELLAQETRSDENHRHRLRTALEVTRHLLARHPVYQCEQCGFQARSLHWQCPSCKSWGTVVPVQPEPIAAHETRIP